MTPDLPQAYICHFTPNRLRLRIPGRRYDAAFFEGVRRRLSEWGSVDRVDVNPVTAGVLVYYSDPAALLADNASRNDLFTMAPDALSEPAPSGGEPLAEQVRQGLGSVDRSLRRLSGGQGGLRSLVLLGLLGTGVVQLLRGNVAVPAVTLFWYAGDMLRLWRDDGPEMPSPGTNERI